MTTDLAEEAGLDVSPIPESAAKQLRELLPAYASGKNPIDMTGTVFGDNPNVVKEVLELLDEEVEDAVLLLTSAQHPAAYERVAETLAPTLTNTKNFAMVTWLAPSTAIEQSFRNSNVPFFSSPVLAIRVLGAMLAANSGAEDSLSGVPEGEEALGTHRHSDGHPAPHMTVLTEDVTKGLLKEAGITRARGSNRGNTRGCDGHRRTSGLPSGSKSVFTSNCPPDALWTACARGS